MVVSLRSWRLGRIRLSIDILIDSARREFCFCSGYEKHDGSGHYSSHPGCTFVDFGRFAGDPPFVAVGRWRFPSLT